MGKHFVIIGATRKKSGGAFAKELSENLDKVLPLFMGGEIRVVLRSTSDTKELDQLLPQVVKFVGSLSDIEFLQKSFVDADTVLNIAGVHYSRKIVDTAAKAGVRRLILVHTTGIYSKYKAAGEEYRQTDAYVYRVCKEHNIVLTILRPTMIYGNQYDCNVIKFITMVDKLPIMPIVNGAYYELQPVHYEDLAKAYLAVLLSEATTGNRDFNLSGGCPIMLRNMLSVIGKNLGKEVKFFSVPYWLAYPGAWGLYLVTFGKVDLREKVQRLCEPRVFFYEDAARAFGYAPRIFGEGIKAEVQEYLKMQKKVE